MPTLIDYKMICDDLGIQSRVATNPETVKDYAEDMECGDTFPPVVVYYNEPEDSYILADGFHRLAAHRIARPNNQILAEVKEGDLGDAAWEAIGANKTNSLRRTNADKRNAVEQALKHCFSQNFTDRAIAKHVGVSHETVRTIRKELSIRCQNLTPDEKRIGQDGKSYPVKIGGGRCKTPIIKTIDGQEHPKPYSTSFKPTAGGFERVANPPPDWARCSNCDWWKETTEVRQGGLCTYANEGVPGHCTACEEWEVAIAEEKPEVKDCKPEVIDLDDNYKFGKPIKKRGQHVHQLSKRANSYRLWLPYDNAELFAVELRDNFEPGYLMSVFSALKKINVES